MATLGQRALLPVGAGASAGLGGGVGDGVGGGVGGGSGGGGGDFCTGFDTALVLVAPSDDSLTPAAAKVLVIFVVGIGLPLVSGVTCGRAGSVSLVWLVGTQQISESHGLP
jgi:hypothetical protein